MEMSVVQKEGYAYHLVNIDCMPLSEHFNIVMELDDSIEELLPYLAASLPGSTYIHGSGVINFMDEGHIVAIYPRRITITDVGSHEEAVRVCEDTRRRISEVKEQKSRIVPVYEQRPSLTVLEIFRSLPGTNCGRCNSPTCMAFAAKVFQRGDSIASCDPIRREREKYLHFLHKLQMNGYKTP